MPHGKQAKMLTPKQETAVLTYLQTRRYPVRDRVMFRLSIKAGLRAKEIARLTWGMVTDADGQVGEVLALPNTASKGHRGGRLIPLNHQLRTALVALHQLGGNAVHPERPVVTSEHGGPLTAFSVTKGCFHLYRDVGMTGCSSHSAAGRASRGRRAKSVKSVEACAMCNNWRAIPRSSPPSGLSRAIRTRSASWCSGFDGWGCTGPLPDPVCRGLLLTEADHGYGVRGCPPLQPKVHGLKSIYTQSACCGCSRTKT